MTSKFVAVNGLERVLIQAATDASARPRFYRLLMESTLYALTPVSEHEHQVRTLEKGETLQIIDWSNGEKSFIPLFTSLEKLDEVMAMRRETAAYLGMNARTFFEVLCQRDTPAVLNPGCNYGKELTTDEMRSLASGEFFAPQKTEVVQQARQILLGQPAIYPEQLVNALADLFSKTPEVEAAYLAHCHDPNSGEPPHTEVDLVV